MTTDAERAAWRAYLARRKAAAVKAGICVTCLAREVEKGQRECAACREKRQDVSRGTSEKSKGF